ncbi:MAG: CCA tRNA nucleotidyltransferase, partial [Acidobacteriaceae bacterium]
TEQILALVANHMRFADVEKMRDSTLKRFFRLHQFEEHLALHRMDCMASHRDLSLYRFALERYQTAAPEQIRPTPLMTGDDLIALGFRPGPEFRNMLTLVEDAQLEGRIDTREQALAMIAERFPRPPNRA